MCVTVCSDGVGPTRTFICIRTQLEQLKTEGVVDFFLFIKAAHIHRAGLVFDIIVIYSVSTCILFIMGIITCMDIFTCMCTAHNDIIMHAQCHAVA